MKNNNMREALYYWNNAGLSILIPKQRGLGFLKCPFGHHNITALADIECEERIDMCGLDGYLFFPYGYKAFGERASIQERVLPKLSKHFKFKAWTEVGSDYFYKHLAATIT